MIRAAAALSVALVLFAPGGSRSEPATPEEALRLEASWVALRKSLGERSVETELLLELEGDAD